jgi:hypothetical protein
MWSLTCDAAQMLPAGYVCPAARDAALAAGIAGRPLAAANADLLWPSEPHLVLWPATNMLREHRSEGHIAGIAL